MEAEQIHGKSTSFICCAKALDRGKGQNWLKSRYKFGMRRRPRGKRIENRKWSGSSLLRFYSTSPLGLLVLTDFQSDYSTFSARPAQRQNNDGRELRGTEGPPLVARWRRPWPRVITSTPPLKCCGCRAIPIALRPTLSIKLAVVIANLPIIARALPAEV